MGEEHYMRDQAASAVEEALRHSTVGVVGGSGENKWKGLGTGTFVEWNGCQLILTAEHVIRGTAAADLRFFLPVQDVPGSADRTTLLDLKGAPTSQLFPFSELPIHGVAVDTNLDLAAIDVTNSVAGNRIVRFIPIEPGGTTPDEGTSIVSRGYPHDLLRQTLDSAQVAFMFVHWASALAPRGGLRDFDSTVHLLTGFEGEEDAHPRGMSGSAGCIQRKRGDRVWVADLSVAGVTIGYYENSRLLKLVRREKIEEFLAAHF
jgi:hypothetical protein